MESREKQPHKSAIVHADDHRPRRVARSDGGFMMGDDDGVFSAATGTAMID
jgi:hypothetical protein